MLSIKKRFPVLPGAADSYNPRGVVEGLQSHTQSVMMYPYTPLATEELKRTHTSQASVDYMCAYASQRSVRLARSIDSKRECESPQICITTIEILAALRSAVLLCCASMAAA